MWMNVSSHPITVELRAVPAVDQYVSITVTTPSVAIHVHAELDSSYNQMDLLALKVRFINVIN